MLGEKWNVFQSGQWGASIPAPIGGWEKGRSKNLGKMAYVD